MIEKKELSAMVLIMCLMGLTALLLVSFKVILWNNWMCM